MPGRRGSKREGVRACLSRCIGTVWSVPPPVSRSCGLASAAAQVHVSILNVVSCQHVFPTATLIQSQRLGPDPSPACAIVSLKTRRSEAFCFVAFLGHRVIENRTIEGS